MSLDDEADRSTNMKVMRLRYAGVCGCGAAIAAGTRAGWVAAERRFVCPECLNNEVPTESPVETLLVAPPIPADAGAAAGESLQAEYERRMAKREKRVTERFPRVGRLLLAVFDESQTTRAFKQGAEGERKAVKRILADAGDDVAFLVNRKLGAGRRDGDIDILAITAAGVHVIDVKRYKDAKVRVEKTGGLFSAREEHLKIRGRESTHLLNSLDRQVDAVRVALGSGPRFADAAVSATLCFVDADLPLFETPVVRGVPVLTPKGCAAILRKADGPWDAGSREDLYSALDEALPPAG